MLPSNENNSSPANHWRLWCRLCAKEDTQGNVSVFIKEEQQSTAGNTTTAFSDNVTEFSLTTAIQKFFWVQITRDEELPTMLCTECFSLVTALVNFAERVSKVQQMYHTLQNAHIDSKLDSHAVRLKYGLLDEFREHVMLPQAMAEVHYFEVKPKINEQEEKIFETEPMVALENPLEHQPPIRIKIKKKNILKVGPQTRRYNANTVEEVEEEIVQQTNDEEHMDEDFKDEHEEDEEEDPFETKEAEGNVDDENFNVEQTTQSSSEEDNPDADRAVKRKVQSIKAEFAQLTRKTTKQGRNTRKHKHNKVQATAVSGINCQEDNNGDGSEELDSDTAAANAVAAVVTAIPSAKNHMTSIHSKLPADQKLSCTQCERVFSNQCQMNKHVKMHLKKVVPCPYCDKKFASNTLAQTHVRCTHLKERSFVCEECGVTVGTITSLRTHKLSHTDLTPYECDICKKSFKSTIRLKKHKETHDPYKHICSECGLQLNSRATLNRHLLVHSDNMQHKCDYCGRAFKRAKALKNHLILHTGLKPYTCDFCDRTFANGSNCRTHKKKTHPEELAALEAAGGGKTYTQNIPKLAALKAVTKGADNLAPVVSKQSGNFAFGKKSKTSILSAQVAKSKARNDRDQQLSAVEAATSLISRHSSAAMAQELQALHTDAACAVAAKAPPAGIPTIDNIYSHIMKQAHIAVAAQSAVNSTLGTQQHDSAITINMKRPASEASAASTFTCVRLEPKEQITTGYSTHAGVLQLQQQQPPQHQQPHQLQLQQLQPNTTPTTTPAPAVSAEQHFYTQIAKQQSLQSLLIHQQQQRQQ